MTIGNIIILIWSILAIIFVVFVILIKIYDCLNKNFSKICIQLLKKAFGIMFGITPIILLIGIILSGLGI